MFYDLFKALCDKKGVSVSRACLDMGLSRSIAAKWKNTKTNPSAEVLPKIANYFGVTADYLLTGEQKENAPAGGEREITDDDIKAAFFGGYSDELPPEEIEELWQDAKDYARFKAEQRRRRGEKS